MIRDRGNIKWTAMMLPEHVKLLREFGDTHDLVEKPILDEDKLEEINEFLGEAMEYNFPLMFSYYYKGRAKTISGNVHYIDVHRKEIRIVTKKEEMERVSFSDVIDISKT
jgi:YolD-like protein